ncbi:sensor histidine kinase [Proteinivorax tanatarense]|uniref:Sensor histidine kinase n=1 Tax=Proteinivorax tanatarense TaxID=1260629 RepID=A0AAU7VK00_9FIRM
MALLFLFVWSYYSELIIQRELYQRENIIKEVKSELAYKHEFTKQGVRQLYFEEDLIEDLVFALQHDYQDYLEYRLNKFAESDSFVPYNFDLFIKNYYSRNPDIVALQIQNEVLNTQYQYLFDHSSWYISEMNDDVDAKERFYTVKVSINDPVSLERIGTMTAYYSYQGFDRVLSRVDEPLKGSVTLSNKEGKNYYTYGEKYKEISPEFGSGNKELKSGGTYFVNSSVEPMSEVMVTSILPRNEVKNLRGYGFRVVLMTSGLAFIAIAIPYFSLRSYSKRVDEIIGKMKEVQNGDMKARISNVKVCDDLSIIAHTFNETLDTLDDYLNKMYFSKLKQKEAELAHLQAQINPHFLYNTLEAIRMKSMAEGGQTSAKMIVQLSKIFRHSLNKAEMVTIREEINHAFEYIELFKNRFPNQLICRFEVGKKVENCYVIPFILQPLIENFLMHGFKRDRDDNKLFIKIEEERQQLSIIIEDNGIGIDSRKVKEIEKKINNLDSDSESIGLSNVNQRIVLKHGENYGVKIESEYGCGTLIKVKLPIIKEVQSYG